MKLKANKDEILSQLYQKRYECLRLKKRAKDEFKFYLKGLISGLDFSISLLEMWSKKDET